jgi:hypothetical protein
LRAVRSIILNDDTRIAPALMISILERKLNMHMSKASEMCNLYSITTNQAAIAALFRQMNRYVGNLEPMPGVFPGYPAPVVRNAGASAS